MANEGDERLGTDEGVVALLSVINIVLRQVEDENPEMACVRDSIRSHALDVALASELPLADRETVVRLLEFLKG